MTVRMTISRALSVTVFMALFACGNEDNNTTSPDMSGGEGKVDMAVVGGEDMSPAEDMKVEQDQGVADAGMEDMSEDMTSPDEDMSEDMAMSDTVTYHKDVKPILNDYCMRCHALGGQGPIDFSSPNTVQTLGEVILSQVESGEMPPPVADPDCRDYLSSEQLSMDAASKETLKKWVELGKPLGEDDGVPAMAPDSATFDNPDLELRLTEPYVPTYEDEQNPNNEYRCFALEHGQAEKFYITGMHPIIDQSAIVHHVVLAKMSRSNAPADTLTTSGQNCINDMGVLAGDGGSGGMVGAWAPGMDPIEFDGAGIEVKPDEVLILQMHYYADRAENMNLPDQSGYALKIADSVRNPIMLYPLGTHDFTIPAGDDNYTSSDNISIPLGITLWGVFPHMHVLGRSYDMKVEVSGSDQCLLEGPVYDFNNQLTYIYKDPLYIPPGSPISYSCSWDNSPNNPDQINSPPKDVGYGERTDEEMCYMFSYVSIGQRRQ